LAVTLNGSELTNSELQVEQKNLENRLGLPVVCPKEEGMERLVPVVQEFLKLEAAKN